MPVGLNLLSALTLTLTIRKMRKMRLSIVLLLSTMTFSSAFLIVPGPLLSTCTNAVKRFKPLLMFTGIVEEMGKVVSLEEREDMTLWDGSKGKGTEIIVQADVVMDGAYLG